MIRACSLLLLLSILGMLAVPAAEGGRLRAAGDATRADGSRGDDDDGGGDDDEHHYVGNGHDHRHRSHYHDDDDDNWFVALIVALRALGSPCYEHHPYDLHVGTDRGIREPLVWNGDIGLIGGRADADLAWYGVGARAVTPIGLGLGGEWLRYREEVGYDHAYADLGDVSLVWRGVESPWFSLDLRLGWLAWHDEIGTEHGGHLAFDAQVFPYRPLLITASSSWGGVGDATVQRYHVGAGAVWRGWSLSAGYRWTDIETVDLDGWELQARFWF